MYRSSYSSAYNDSVFGVLAGMSTFMIVLIIALAVFEIICLWRIFEKAGEPGWKCLIPIYNLYVFMKICWEAKYFIYLILGIIGAAIIFVVGLNNGSGAMGGFAVFLMIALYIAIGILAIIAQVKLARRFGKSGGFAVGLIFLNTIFMAILAFDQSNYDRSRTGGYVGTSSSSSYDSKDSGNDNNSWN